MHYLTHIEHKEAIYHIRIYSVGISFSYPNGVQTTSLNDLPLIQPGETTPLNPWQMNTHGMALALEKPVEFSPELIDAIAPLKVSAENEIRIGVPRFDNLKFNFKADPVFMPIIGELKNSGRQIWCEVVREDLATDIPDLPAGAMLFPRKKRCIFWGKCIPQPSRGTVENQSFVSEGGSQMIAGYIGGPKERLERQHTGGLELVFKHWLVALGTRTTLHKYVADGDDLVSWNPELNDLVVEWLDAFREEQHTVLGRTHIHISDLLYSLLEKLSPAPLFAIADHRWQHTFTDLPDAIERGNVHLDITLEDSGAAHTATNLYQIGWQLWDAVAGAYKTLFDDDDANFGKNPSQYSLYRLKNGIEALVKLLQEFKLVFQCELPTLEEAAKQNSERHLGNLLADRQSQWEGCARWSFMQQTQIIRDMPKLEFTTKKKTLGYSPCGAWLSKIRVDEPSDFGTVHLVPNYSEYRSGFEDGQDLSYKTISRIDGQLFTGGPRYNGASGTELWIQSDVIDTWVLAIGGKAPTNFLGPGGETSIADWADWHAFDYITRWAQPRTILDFEIFGNGVEKFGTSASIGGFTASVKKHFGFYDWSEFPLYRTFGIADPGLLQYNSNQYMSFTVLEISRNLNGDSVIKAIEMQYSGSAAPPVVGPPSDPPEPPQIDTPPAFTGSPMCGENTIIFCVLYPSGCVDHADIFLDSVKIGTTTIFSDPMPEDCIPVQVNLNTMLLPNGLHQICLDVYVCGASSPVTQCWSFRVQNPCSAANTATKYWSP